MNAAPSTEAQNLVERASALMRELVQFGEWEFTGRSWWGLACWRAEWGDAPKTWNENDEQLVAEAWGCGEFVLTRYGPRVGRASPILDRDELSRFLEALFSRTGALLENTHLRVVFQRRFAAGTAVRTVELIDDLAVANSDPSAGLQESEIEACALAALEEITPRQAEIVRRKRTETLDQIALELGIARGTVDNELTRVGVIVKRLAGELSAAKVLEKLLDLLSINMT
jgi:DNA-binding CsgD family transcriptional regulator